MLNDGYPPNRFDPVRSGTVLGALGWSAMLPSLTSSAHAVDRLARLDEAQRGQMSMNRTGFVRDERDERLQRAGYLLVVYVDGLVRTAAALVLAMTRRRDNGDAVSKPHPMAFADEGDRNG